MTRQEALAVIELERVYQLKTWRPEQVNESGLTRAQREKTVSFYLTMLQVYVDKAHAAWANTNGEFESARQIGKIAAIATAALENCGAAQRILTEGLR